MFDRSLIADQCLISYYTLIIRHNDALKLKHLKLFFRPFAKLRRDTGSKNRRNLAEAMQLGAMQFGVGYGDFLTRTRGPGQQYNVIFMSCNHYLAEIRKITREK